MMRLQSRTLLAPCAALLACSLAAVSAPSSAQDEPAQSEESDGRIMLSPKGDSSFGPPSIPDPEEGDAIADQSKGPNVLVLLAHPDDEIPFAPALSRMTRSGGTVTMVFATSGEAGPGVSGMEPGAELAELRESEGRCATFAMNLPEPIYWQLPDGGLAARARLPDSAAREMEQRITALIEVMSPQVVLTWGPEGGYGHADHRMISAVATQVIQQMGSKRPELLYLALPAGTDVDVPGFDAWGRVAPDLVTDRISYELADVDATRLAVDCYQSQFGAEFRAMLPSLLHRDIWQGKVLFRQAFPVTNQGD